MSPFIIVLAHLKDYARKSPRHIRMSGIGRQYCLLDTLWHMALDCMQLPKTMDTTNCCRYEYGLITHLVRADAGSRSSKQGTLNGTANHT